ncbi:transposable element Tcb1 transposase [Trichonephila clavipes]|nr:transposable element Tcb1 transposase [Trichonephila clavipes]
MPLEGIEFGSPWSIKQDAHGTPVVEKTVTSYGSSFIGRCPDSGSTFTIGPVSSGIFAMCLAERRLVSWHPLRVLPMTPVHRNLRLERCRTRRDWIATEWKQVVFSDESSRFDLSSDGNRVRVWKAHGESLKSAFALQRYTASTADVMVWSVIAYDTRSPLTLIHGTMTVQQYVHDNLQPHVFLFRAGLPGAIFQQDIKNVARLPLSRNQPSLACWIPRFVTNRAVLGSFGI